MFLGKVPLTQTLKYPICFILKNAVNPTTKQENIFISRDNSNKNESPQE